MPRAPALLFSCLLGLCALVPRLPGLNICTSGSATSCEECLLIHPKCAWCFKEDFGSLRSVTSRCDLKANLIRNGCGVEFESPASSTQVLRSLPLSSKGSSPAGSDVIQLTPQEVTVTLRPGDRTAFQLQVRQVEDYPVDLYYLMDLSLSMKDDLENIRSLGTKLAEEMRKLTSNFRLGFGSFVDKNISPFSYTAPRYQTNPCIGYKLFPNCVPSFGFRHLLPLTDRVDSFNEEVRKQRVSRNRDAPEGGFDAVLQAAVCKEKIGWRKDALHLLVFTTDDVPHIALDGKLGGLVQPHDGQCHLNEANEYTASNQMDYPSLALLGEKLAENNINLIFAVTKNHYMLYKNFTALIPGTTVEILHGDSKNILQLIINAYNSIRSKVELSVWDQPEDLNLFFTATCQDGVSYPGQRKCEGLKIGDTASFEVSVEARSCPSKHVQHTFTLRPVGFRDSLEVGVTYNCRCGCSAGLEPDSARCSSNGTYVCGLCECNPGYLGTRCECQEGESQSGYQNLCREAEGKPLCSGRGQCSCNQCSCFESEFGKIYGSFCECDNFSCARNKGVLCSGHGECHCGECKCHAGYIGDNCNCSTDISTCQARDGHICSDRGHCVCGQCQCTEPGAFGETCEKCPTCPDACSTKRDCVECLLLHSGSSADNQTCQNLCKDEVITRVDTIVKDDQEAVLCFYKTAKDCVMMFTYSELPSGKSNLTVLREPECGTAPSAMTILLAVVGSILLTGFALLVIWKLLVTIHDRREFAKFQSERSRARYEMVRQWEAGSGKHVKLRGLVEFRQRPPHTFSIQNKEVKPEGWCVPSSEHSAQSPTPHPGQEAHEQRCWAQPEQGESGRSGHSPGGDPLTHSLSQCLCVPCFRKQTASHPRTEHSFKPSVQKAHLHAHCGFHLQQVQQILQWHSGLTAPSPQRAGGGELSSQRLTRSGQLLSLIAAPCSTERRDLPASPGREPVQEGARLCRLATPPSLAAVLSALLSTSSLSSQ